jgi:hypothetical protein
MNPANKHHESDCLPPTTDQPMISKASINEPGMGPPPSRGQSLYATPPSDNAEFKKPVTIADSDIRGENKKPSCPNSGSKKGYRSCDCDVCVGMTRLAEWMSKQVERAKNWEKRLGVKR